MQSTAGGRRKKERAGEKIGLDSEEDKSCSLMYGDRL